MTKLGIIGLGRVGSQVLTDVQSLNIFSEIVLIDTNEQRASGEPSVHEHIQGLPDSLHVDTDTEGYEILADAEFIVVTSSVPTDAEVGDRVALAQGKRKMINAVMEQISQVTQDAIIILVS